MSSRSAAARLNQQEIVPLQAPSLTMDSFKAFGAQVNSAFSKNVTPFAARTQQFFKEQTGNGGEKTELPPDYLELEARVDALKQTHQKLLNATAQYTNEAYDYPPNIRESFQDVGRTISEKVCSACEYTAYHAIFDATKANAHPLFRFSFCLAPRPLRKPSRRLQHHPPQNRNQRPSTTPSLAHHLPAARRSPRARPTPTNRTRSPRRSRDTRSRRRRSERRV